MMLPWHAVKGIDWHHAQINVNSFDCAQSVTKESLRSLVLLMRDVIDALVLDLHNSRAVRRHRIRKKDAERYWELVPAPVDEKVISLATANVAI